MLILHRKEREGLLVYPRKDLGGGLPIGIFTWPIKVHVTVIRSRAVSIGVEADQKLLVLRDELEGSLDRIEGAPSADAHRLTQSIIAAVNALVHARQAAANGAMPQCYAFIRQAAELLQTPEALVTARLNGGTR